MNISVWIWIFLAFMFIISMVLLVGKGSFLIAGYNTSSKEEKEKYNEKKLCRVVGSGLGIITAIMTIFAFYEFELPSAISWIMPWGLFLTVAVMMILANTICKKA